MRFKDGGYYEGDFKNDEMTGQGTRRFANGSTFIGKGGCHELEHKYGV
jgi:hypothetical protein